MAALIGPALLQRLVAERTGLDPSTVTQVEEAYEAVALELLGAGARLRAVGGGILVMVETKPTRRRNPQTGEMIEVPSKKKIVIKQIQKR